MAEINLKNNSAEIVKLPIDQKGLAYLWTRISGEINKEITVFLQSKELSELVSGIVTKAIQDAFEQFIDTSVNVIQKDLDEANDVLDNANTQQENNV